MSLPCVTFTPHKATGTVRIPGDHSQHGLPQEEAGSLSHGTGSCACLDNTPSNAAAEAYCLVAVY